MTIQKDTCQTSTTEMSRLLEKQKEAYLTSPLPSKDERIDKLNKLNDALFEFKDRLIRAVSVDFSHRSESETLMLEIIPLLEGIAYNRKRIRKWMKPEKRHSPITLLPAKVEVYYQPVGVVGIVVPWNFPIFLGLSPLIGAISAGNKAMIKTSEFAPQTSAIIKQMLASVFHESEVTVIEGEVEVSRAFTSLPFDHLVFTGATNVGKQVMKSAAENLTPVTLELGGKSPAIIHNSFPIKEAASRLAFGKALNAGQVCVSPDYIMCPEGQEHELAKAFVDIFSTRYPNIRNNADYTAIISERQLARLNNIIKDAEEKGATIITINPADETFEGTRKMPMTLMLNVNDDMLVMQEEIFGPILPILTYTGIKDALNYISAKDRPLALYYFDWDKKRADEVMQSTHSGGACINDSMTHVMVDDIPFGGIGASGMGHYHGHEGFLNFSKAKGIVRKGRINTIDFIAPPWNNTMFRLLSKFQLWRLKR
ncbi:coniferyl aldehyde dehydrogenase [Alteromonas macleodii]